MNMKTSFFIVFYEFYHFLIKNIYFVEKSVISVIVIINYRYSIYVTVKFDDQNLRLKCS